MFISEAWVLELGKSLSNFENKNQTKFWKTAPMDTNVWSPNYASRLFRSADIVCIFQIFKRHIRWVHTISTWFFRMLAAFNRFSIMWKIHFSALNGPSVHEKTNLSPSKIWYHPGLLYFSRCYHSLNDEQSARPEQLLVLDPGALQHWCRSSRLDRKTVGLLL